jgi:ankyrin repeat protein
MDRYSTRCPNRSTTFLHIASRYRLLSVVTAVVEKRHEAVVRLLLAKKGVDLDSKDEYGQTPLWWAARNGHEVVVKLLQSRGALSL